MPRALYHEGQRLPASYANFYIANGVVLLPTYDPAARRGRPGTRCRSSFPAGEVVGIDCTDLVWGLGRLPLRHPAVAGLSHDFFQVPTSAARRPPQVSMPTPAMCSSSSVRLTT